MIDPTAVGSTTVEPSAVQAKGDAPQENEAQQRWIVCQLGAREHYALARALHADSRLHRLVTDIWARPGSLVTRLPGGLGARLRERYAAGLADASVEHFTVDAVRFESSRRLRRSGPGGWPMIMARNEWFQRRASRRLAGLGLLRHKPVVFAYSYAALDIFRVAKAAGCRTVLGQIDPALTEEDIVAGAVARHAALAPAWSRAPAAYWNEWREECALADRIVVNSQWSRDGLMAVGVDPSKIDVVPLAYQSEAAVHVKNYPERFDEKRPMRVVFLGSVIIRKGAGELIEAIRKMRDMPVEFDLVGTIGVEVPTDIQANPKVRLHGPTGRGSVRYHYDHSDVFILPSLSDGFGLTMLEAMSAGLPVVASRRCGDVVTEGVDGLLIDDVSGDAIARALGRLSEQPALLSKMSTAASNKAKQFAPDGILRRLIEAQNVV